MAQQVTALVTKPDNLSSTLGRHMVEREHSLPQVVLGPPLCAVAPPTHTHKPRESVGRRAQSVINKQINTCNNKNKISVERK